MKTGTVLLLFAVVSVAEVLLSGGLVFGRVFVPLAGPAFVL